MNDKELLMMAAKAAGEIGEYVEDYSPGDYYADQFYCGSECGVLTGSLGCYHVWNPLIDDGDALRLAVKLNLLVDNNGPYAECFAPTMRNTVAENHNTDPYAATRRAIVRAAAEIGGKL